MTPGLPSGGMRFAALFVVAACGQTAPVTTAPAHPTRSTHVAAREPIDILAALGDTGREVSFIVPGTAQLELGGALVQAPDGAEALEVIPLDDRGNDVRVGVRLEHARFALWTQRARMLAIVARDQRVEERAGAGFTPYSAEPVEARLRATALVRRLGHKITGRGSATSVRSRSRAGFPTPRSSITAHGQRGRSPDGPHDDVTPGAVIRSEPSGPRGARGDGERLLRRTDQEVDDAGSRCYEDGESRCTASCRSDSAGARCIVRTRIQRSAGGPSRQTRRRERHVSVSRARWREVGYSSVIARSR